MISKRRSQYFGTRGRLLLTIVFGAMTWLGPNFANGQVVLPEKSPKAVLEAYRRMDSSGERLTNEGWYRASEFFLRSAPPPTERAVQVIETERIDEHPAVTPTNAEIGVPCLALGQIDSKGRFTSVVAPFLLKPDGSGPEPVDPSKIRGPAPFLRMYTLVLTQAHWEYDAKAGRIREVKTRPEWRIENLELEPWVTVEVALRYLATLRDSSADESIRENAHRSIGILQKLVQSHDLDRR